MALNVKILFPLDHPPVTKHDDEPVELSATASELDTDKENLHKGHVFEKEQDHIYRDGPLDHKKKKLNILN